MLRNAWSASRLIVAGILGSLVARASCTFTSPSSIVTDLIKPKETMSRLNPGYFTDFSASRISASLIAIEETYREHRCSKDSGDNAAVRLECSLATGKTPKD